jgi:polysaccharide export outer membrane protein
MIDFQGPLAPSKSTSTIIGSGDLLAIAVFDVPELSGTFRVGDDGFISLPLIGPLKVDGKLTVQLESQLADAFRYRKLIVDPQVSIQIIEFVAQGVTVGGEVVRPGVYPALGSHKLADLIAAAGGTTPMAGWIATVNHRRGGKTEDVAILSSDGRAAGGEVDLSSGDTVTVQRAGIVYVLGDVGRPGGFTIDRETVSVTQAVALAQGFTRSSSLNKARILSSKDGAFTEFSFDLRNILNGKSRDLSLRNGDVLYIPQSGAKALFQAGSTGFLGALAAASVYSAAGKF